MADQEVNRLPATDPRGNRPLRSDAAQNQQRVLAAAVTAILREGQNVPLATIAKEAGVGVGTLYRRYANREALFDDLELHAYELVLSALEEVEALHEPALRSVELFLERTVAHRSQLVLPFHGSPESQSPDVRAIATRVGDAVRSILERGRDDGTIREGIRPIDVIIFGAMIAQPLPGTQNWEKLAAAQIRVFVAGIAAAPAG